MDSVSRLVHRYTAELLPLKFYNWDDSETKPSSRATQPIPSLQSALAVVDAPTVVEKTVQDIHGSELSVDANNRMPPELLVKIFAHAEIPLVLRCRSVCKRFQQVIDGTPAIQYMIELFVSGYRDNEADSSTNVVARLEALVASQKWQDMPGSYSWKRERWDLPVSAEAHLRVQRYDNVWFAGHQDPQLLNGARALDFEMNKVECTIFETTPEGSPIIDSWTLSFPFLFSIYVADTSRGVLHLMSLSLVQNRRHFRVRTVSSTDGSILDDHEFIGKVEREGTRWDSYSDVYCVNNLLACLSVARIAGQSFARQTIVFLDLSSGEIVATQSIKVPASVTIRYQFLSREVYLVHVMSEGKFSTEVYKLVPHASSHMFRIHRVAIFEYPQVRGKYAGPEILSICPQHIQGHSLNRNAPPAPFLRAEYPPLIVVHRSYYIRAHIVHYIRSSVFMSVAKDFIPSDQPRGVGPVIQWEYWGPQNSRCVVDRDARRSMYRASCFGNQALTPDLEVWDFNQLAFAREHQCAIAKRGLDSTIPLPADGSYWGILPMRKLTQFFKSSDDDDEENFVTKPTIIRKDPILASDVMTRLPYRKAKLDVTGVPDHRLRGGFLGHLCVIQTVLADNLPAYYVMDKPAS